ncbi:uncharacterized protein LOC107668441 [Sinocyclocheilus anshuiensis]|uniref:uncharacterized protein LOC107668441 n=1 Tax=Sinocyclocheilus anshuiensis TaxID=1608454 RepID=UPI0007B90444|nr:PREDICTED: uncharacterized protein LOC107668441 [Sinocyclocheilus anshuiensis]
MREAGLRVQPNLSRFSVSTIVRTFREENRIARLPHAGGRTAIFTWEQEAVIVGIVLQDNVIRLREIQERVIQDNTHFQGIDSVSISTIDRVLHRNRMRIKQVYRVPFERNSPRVKELRAQYVQTIFDLESLDRPHDFIFVDEAGFNLTKRRRRGRNMIGQRAIVEVPGQRGGNVTICAAISNHGVLHHHVTLGPYNTQHLLRFIANLRYILFEQQVQEQQGQELNENPIPTYVIVWDNVSFHRAAQVREWFNINGQFMNLYLPPYSPFLNPIEEFFSSWRWKVYDRQPYTRVNLLQAMDLACGDIGGLWVALVLLCQTQTQGEGQGQTQTQGEGQGQTQTQTQGEGQGQTQTQGEGQGQTQTQTQGEGQGQTQTQGEGQGQTQTQTQGEGQGQTQTQDSG